MFKKPVVTTSLIIFLLSFASPFVAALDGPVRLTAGLVSGVELDNDIKVFRGIPYAAPPVGELRWKPPQPPTLWEGVRPADSFGPACMQSRDIYMSEDCLYLNIWTGAENPQQKLPVMLWIHGGGWSSGASSSAIYDGTAFAEKGVVLVSVNYRMNAFGFMAHPALSAESEREVSGNYGILDHIAALEWVRDNIEAFGGDPDNVTIFGESAGGASVYALLASPLASGLFHKAISQSTWITSYNVSSLRFHNGFTESAEAASQRAIVSKLRELGIDLDENVLGTIRGLSAMEILDLDFQVALVEDGWVFPDSPAEIFKQGSHNRVPLLAGINDGEGLFFVRPQETFTTVDEQSNTRLREWGRMGQQLARYYLADTAEEIFPVEVDYNTDSWFARPTREILTAMSITSTPTYMYLFTRNLRDPSQRAPHAMELRYVFNTLPEQADDADWQIAGLMQDYWIQFATTGNPNTENLPLWPAYNNETRQYQIIGADIGQGAKFRDTELNALDRYFERTYESTP